jgi:putative membrane protein
MNYVWEILKGAVIGLANIIPGVSGGTMMVSMGIYDTLIYCITHLFKEFKRSIKTLLPYAIGMVLAIGGLSFALKWLFANYPLPTNTLFIGLILGGLPAILKNLKGSRIKASGWGLFGLFFALIVLMQAFQTENVVSIQLSLFEVIKLFFIGAIASATMVIPGVSGSMILKLIGYYEPIVTGAIPGFISALAAGDWMSVLTNAGILIPFGLGVVIGIFAIAKLIEVLLAKQKVLTYCAILGLVVASPVAILMGADMSGVNVIMVLVSILTFALGFGVAMKLGGEKA